MYAHAGIRAVMGHATWLVLFFAVVGCDSKVKDAGAPPAPMVTVSNPTERQVVQFEYATGRVEAVESIDVRSRVSGHLVKIHFRPGTEVAAGAPLFEIDPEPFKADLAKAEAELIKSQAEVPVSEALVARDEARLIRATADFRRAETMRPTNAISVEEFDKARADMLEAQAFLKGAKAKVDADKAKVEADKANVRAAKLNLDFCSIRAPVAGRVGDTLVTQGNLVTGGPTGATLLTTEVSVDPMYVAFDVDENTLQRIQKAEREGRITGLRVAGEIPAEMGLSIHGVDYPLKGTIKFVNNQVDAKTGTIRMKAEFANPKPPTGARVLSPGMFARIRIPIGTARKAMVVPDSAILSDQGVTYLLAVDAQNKAVRLDVETGPAENGQRVIESARTPGEANGRALRADEKIIVSGLQRVRAGMVVDPKPPASK